MKGEIREAGRNDGTRLDVIDETLFVVYDFQFYEPANFIIGEDGVVRRELIPMDEKRRLKV